MAVMYPRSVHPATKSPAERRLFERFAADLSDHYHIFHSVGWQFPGSMGLEDGETDFIVAHPEYGALVIEVKGGSIAFDGRSGRWYSGDHDIKDPLSQARRAKYSLLGLLKTDARLRDKWILVGYAVAFPDIQMQGDLKADLPRIIIMDNRDVNRLDSWLIHVFDYWKGEMGRDSAPGDRFIHRLKQFLAPSWDLTPRLPQQFQLEEVTIERLTEEQSYLLDFIGKERRVAIAGCAGSGKTVLAMEKAIRLSDAGFDVLLVCFNRNLAKKLAYQLSSYAKITVSTFHSLCSRLCNDAGIQQVGKRDEAFFSDTLPELTLEAIDIIGPRFDAVIVDEGQDFASNWWIVLDSLLRAGGDDVFYIFFDDNQFLYHERLSLPMEVASFKLTRNLRNTQSIFSLAKRFYRSDQSTIAAGPEGRPVQFIPYEGEKGLHKCLRRLLHSLIMEEGLDSSKIVILTPHSKAKSSLWDLSPFGNFNLVDEPGGGGAEVYCTTIHSFKGLESPVVILTELDNKTLNDLDTVLYVGSTRACNHLIVMGMPEVLDNLVPGLE